MVKTKDSFISRFFRFLISTVVLSALVVGIAFLIKGIHGFDDKKFARFSSDILAKLNINVQEEQIGEVAGKVIERVSNTNISATSTSRLDASDSLDTSKDAKLKLEVAIIADVQEDVASLVRSLEKIKERNINKVIVIGDLTNYGEISDLQDIKQALDDSGVIYYVLPGDHDLAASLNSDNFIKVFGKTNYVIDMDGYNFLFLDNSANYTALGPSVISWFVDEITTADFVFLSQPLYVEGLNPPFNKMYMGSTRDVPSDDLKDRQLRVKEQRDILLDNLQSSAVSAVFGADHHKSSKIIDSIRSTLEHYTLGAIASEVNDLPQRLLQSSRFSILNIYEDDSYEVEEVLID